MLSGELWISFPHLNGSMDFIFVAKFVNNDNYFKKRNLYAKDWLNYKITEDWEIFRNFCS